MAKRRLPGCNVCGGRLRQIGKIAPDNFTPYLIYTPAIDKIAPRDGAGWFAASLMLGMLVSSPLWAEQLSLAIAIICGAGGLGAWLWRRPRDLYRCGQCGGEFVGRQLWPLKRF
ncbi:hypothetical protein [Oceanobacter mangrovi]|uniref:hypothetical protein n=1 Tax=Oceanobacter mangrovi TaxID=2862510 RepID=UPI001C8DC6E0|nr:hypothetical protein [Oceanobacter mangrovi]